MNKKKIPIILDGDPGHDDAIAWVLAKADPAFDIRAITTVAGNQTIEKVTYNAQRIVSLLDIDLKVAKGRSVPLLSDLTIAPDYHGVSGLDGPSLPEPKHEVSELSAVEMMAQVLKQSDDKVTIVATGPQTNVAGLLLAHPELKEKIECISIMGGGIRNGNWTASAEFNILCDPEAAYIEFHSGIPIIMCGLDVTEKAIIYPEEWDKIRKIDNEVAETVAKWLDFFFKHLSSLGWAGATLHDPCSILMLNHPEIFKTKDIYVDIDLSGEYTRGATIGDNLNRFTPNCKVVVDVDRERFVELIYEACKSYGGCL